MKFALLCLLTLSSASAEDWLRFRGPNGSGLAESTPLPREIGPDKNVVWKQAIPRGKSSPVVTSNRVFLTGHEGGKLFTFALDRKTGALLWRHDAPSNQDEKRHTLNDPASPSPVSDGSNVYVFFAGYGLLSYTADGVERWRVPLGPFTNFHGMGASPVLADGKLLLPVLDAELPEALCGKSLSPVSPTSIFVPPVSHRLPAGRAPPTV